MKVLFSKLSKVILVNLFISLLFFSIVVPGIVWEKNNTFQERDQNNHHLLLIETFVNEPLSWGNYPPTTVAMTPGHHVFLSWVSKKFFNGKVGPKVFPLRISNTLFGLGLLLTVWWLTYLGKTRNIIETTCLVFPLLFSYQFLGSSIWITTDNGALLWSCLTLLTITLPSYGNTTLFLLGMYVNLAVLWRQIYIWILAPILLYIYQNKLYKKHLNLCLITLLTPILVLIYFVFLWHGLTPPLTRGYHTAGFNVAVAIYVISLFGTIGLFYVGYLSREIKDLLKLNENALLIVISVIIGLGIAFLFPTSYDKDAGRWGGALWEISRQLPSFYDRSLLFMVLLPLGAVLISLWFKATYRNGGELIFVSMIAWVAAYTTNPQAWQRYYESLILITFAFLASRRKEHFRLSYIGPLILAGLMGAISLQQIIFASG